MSTQQIERAILDAYRYGKKLRTQGDTVLVEGYSHDLRIHMWVNMKTYEIETAYPKFD